MSAQFRAHRHNTVDVPPPQTKTPRKKRSLRPRPEPRGFLRREDDGDCVEVEGRLGKSFLTGKAIEVYRTWNPSIFNFPPTIPVEEEIIIGGRRWIVKPSTLGPNMGYGLFACEDIDVPANLGRDMQYAPALFPYVGPIYIARHWKVLVKQNPSWKVYQIDLDGWPGCHKRREHSRVIDGDPVRYPNIAGYINSSRGIQPQRIPNVEWNLVDGSPPFPFHGKTVDDHVMTVAISPIRAGDELLCAYEWDPI